ncbi:anthrone oxygenase family protein [Spongiactinospora sp. 9N601]|uniref:anthrone oxygenase family protein n=1 Tax=Spongiactinospora sp. 9N601 TaxID=3375149 RepID=UPI0037892E7A
MLLARILTATVIVGNGLVAGVLFSHAIGVWPAMRALAPDRYIAFHKSFDRAYDPLMPIIVITAVICDAALAVLSADLVPRVLFASSAVALIASGVVSQTRNVPINHRVKALDPAAIPIDWVDPRGEWEKWNHVRTVFAVLALIGNAAAAVSAI